MDKAPERVLARRIAALITVIGGGLLLVGEFLPNGVTPQRAIVAGQNQVKLVLSSNWDGISRLFTQVPSVDQQSGVVTYSGPFAVDGLIACIPLALGVLLVLFGVLAFVRRPGPLRAGFHVTTASFVALSTIYSFTIVGVQASYYNYGGSGYPASIPTNLIGLGSLVMDVGAFVALAGSFALALRNRA